MIRYALKCSDAHGFDGWFPSADAFDRLLGAGGVACPVCGGTAVSKDLMAPAVAPARGAKPQPTAADAASSARATQRRIEADAEHVGRNFAAEARAIHDGTAPARTIWGEAKPEDARRLIEDGIPVAPMPFAPTRKMH